MTDHVKIHYLFERYYQQIASPEEKAELMELLDNVDDDELAGLTRAAWENQGTSQPLFTEAKSKEILHKILQGEISSGYAPVIKMNRRGFYWLRIVAAVFILSLGVGSYFFFNRNAAPHFAISPIKAVQDIAAPTSAHAVITLINGKQITLDSAVDGLLTLQENVQTIKLSDGAIAYSGAATQLFYNTLSNPRGSQPIRIRLADRSMVWLNAESSLRYPVAFTGNERKVEITGEAYFEISHNVPLPFVVQKGNMKVNVLGTHFNVSAYDNEGEIKVTLLEGRVKVDKGTNEQLLSSGEQARLSPDDRIIRNKNADIRQVMAWKEGLFKFKDTNIEAIMRQVSRWYDVEIQYRGDFSNLNFGGTISRKANVSELLKLLEATESVRFIIEGRKIIVTK
jgi:ferric-dicitrate binding protein FerR (iron transport regulator)